MYGLTKGSVSFNTAPYLDRPSSSAVDFIFDECYFPHSAQNTHFRFGGKDARAYLIAPSYVKVPAVEMIYLMLDALNAAANAKNLIVIGSSLRPEDSFLMVIITHFLRQPGWESRKIILVDPCASDICGRLKNFWGVNVKNQITSIDAPFDASIELLAKSMQ